MKVKVKGKGPIDQWRSALQAMPGIMSDLGEQMAEEAVDLIAEGFANQRDPYGQAWKPKKLDDGRSILVGKTTRLRRGWQKRRTGHTTWQVSSSVEYATAHQDPQARPKWGGKKLPRRMMVPSAARGLPPEWKKAFAAATREALRQQFKSSGGKLGLVKYKIIGLKRRFNALAIIRKAFRQAFGE